MYCSACGAQLAGMGQFCSRCGAAAAGGAPQPLMQPVLQPVMYFAAPTRVRGPRAPGTAVAALVLGVISVVFGLLGAPLALYNRIGLIVAVPGLISGGLALGLGYSARR